ncbi:cellulose binding domain-containing protein [Streptomyces sp. M41]|uniref:cellulose binding domain-containing protein n=1 Tax=Streptomyces sp. M41 TaxID=3059412 RepID=UPI00374D686D
MPTRPDPERPDEEPARESALEPALEPIHVLRPRRTDALAELFREIEQDGGNYETVPLPSTPAVPEVAACFDAEDETQELPPVAAPRPRLRRTTVGVVVAAAAVVGFGGALLLPDRGADPSAAAPDRSSTDSGAAAGSDRTDPADPTTPTDPGDPGAGAPGAPPPACTASYRTVTSWQGGYQGEVTVTNAPAAAASGWTATVVPTEGARLTQVWDGTLDSTRSGAATVANASWNGVLEPGASVTFGFIADASASTGTPSATVTCAATAEGA